MGCSWVSSSAIGFGVSPTIFDRVSFDSLYLRAVKSWSIMPIATKAVWETAEAPPERLGLREESMRVSPTSASLFLEPL